MPKTNTVYVLEEGDIQKFRNIVDSLNGGTDRERDFGHRLWLILNNLSELPKRYYSVDGHGNIMWD